MLDHILVEKEWLEVREAAQKGNLDALLQLAGHLIGNDKIKPGSKNLRSLAEAIARHQDFGKMEDPAHLIELCKIMADYYHSLYSEGQLDGESARDEMRTKYRELIYWSAQLPFEEWDIATMKNCMDWLAADAFELID